MRNNLIMTDARLDSPRTQAVVSAQEILKLRRPTRRLTRYDSQTQARWAGIHGEKSC